MGRQIAEKIKKNNIQISDLIKGKMPKGETYENLTPKERIGIWKEIIKSSGRDRSKTTKYTKIAGVAGRGLWAMTAGMAAYNVLTSDDKISATIKEAGTIGGGLAGAWAGAKLGLACGPYAWVCSPVGVLIGGFAGAEGVDWAMETVGGWSTDGQGGGIESEWVMP